MTDAQRFRRVVQWAALLVAVLLAALAILHLPPIENRVSRALVRALAERVDGRLEIGRLDYSLWKGAVSVVEVEYERVDEGLTVSVRIPRIEIAWMPLSRVDLFVQSPVVELRERGGPERAEAQASDTTSPLEPRLPPFLGHIFIEDGRFQWIDASGRGADLGPFDLRLDGSEIGGFDGRLTISGGSVLIEGEAIQLRRGEASLEGMGGTLHVDESRFDFDAGSVKPEAEIRTLSPFSGDLAVDFRLERAAVGKLLDETSLQGRFDGDVRLSVREAGVTGEGSLEARGLSWRQIGPWQAELDWELTRGALLIHQLQLRGYDGSLHAEARLELTDGGQQTAKIQWTSLSLLPLSGVREVKEASIPWQATTSGTANLSFVDWDIQTLSGSAAVDLYEDIEGRVLVAADDGDLAVSTSQLVLPGGSLSTEAKLENLRQLAADVHLSLDDVSPLISVVLPENDVNLEGPLEVEASVGGDIATPETLQSRARLGSDGLLLNGEKLSLDGLLHYQNEIVRVDELLLKTTAGRLSANGTARLSGSSTLEVYLESFPLHVVPPETGIEDGAVSGPILIEGPIADPNVDARLEVDDLVYRGIRGSATIAAQKRGPQVNVERLDLSLGEGALQAAGTFDTRTREIDLSAEGRELALHRLLATAGWPASLRARLARVDVNVTGPLHRPSGNAVLHLEDLAFRGEALPAASITLDSNGVEAVTELSLDSGGRLLIAETSLREDFPSTVTLTLDYVPWNTFVTGLEWEEVTGVEVSGQIESRLPLGRPRAFSLDAKVAEMQARIGGVIVHAPTAFRVSADAESVQLDGFALSGDGVDLRIDGNVALADGEESSLNARGELALEPWAALVPGDALGGTAELHLTFAGGLERPLLEGSLSVRNGRWADGPWVVEDLETVLHGRGAVIEMEQLEATVMTGSLSAQGTFPLANTNTEGDGPSLSFRLRELDLGPVLAGEESAEGTELLISVEGDASFGPGSLTKVDASGVITEVLLRTPASEVASTSPARWRFNEERFDLDRLELSGTETRLEIGAEASLAGEEAGWSTSLRGNLDLALASAVLPESAFASGSLQIDAQVSGGAGQLVLEGTSRVEGGELVLERPPLVLSEIDVDVRLDDDEIVLEHLKAQANGGTLTANGRLLRTGDQQEDESGTSIQMVAEGLRLEYPEGLRSRIDAELELSDGEDYQLAGQVVIDQARYARDVSVERELFRAIRRQTVDIAREPGLADRLHLEVDVDSNSDIVMDNNLGQVQAEANVLVTGTAASPEISGTARVRPGGEIRFAGNSYDIETARVDLYGYPTTPPEIDVRAHTESGGYDLVLELSGSLDNLRTTLSSPGDPSLSRADVTSLLLTGRTLEEVSGEEGRILGEQAGRYLAGGLASVTEDELGEALPVTSVSIAPTLVGSETDPGARLSLSQGLSEDLQLTYSIGLSDTQSQLWIIDYELPRDLRVRAIRDDANEYTGALSQTLAFDVYHRQRPTELRELEGSEIQSVRLDGELPRREEEIHEELSLSPGDRFDYWEAQEDAEEIRRKLQDEGYLGAQVLVHAEETGDSSDEVSVAYAIELGRPIRIVWSGDEPGEDLRKSASEEWDPHLPAGVAARRVATRLTWELKSRGFYDAAIEATVLESPNEVEVRFHVERGTQGSKVEIEFLGNEVIEDDILETLLPDPSTPAFFRTVLAEEEEFRDRVQLLYATRGYLEGRVVEMSERFESFSGTYRVEIPIEEGEPTYVTDVVFDGVGDVPEERLRSLLTLRPGAALRLDEFLQDQRKLRSFYRGEGFADSRVRSRLRRSSDGFRVVHEVEENERLRVGRIDITGNAVTDEDTIQKALTVNPGDPLRLEDLTETQSRLYDLQTFRSVDVRAEPSQNPGVSDVMVDVVELPDVTVGYGARYSTEDRWEVTGNVDFPNLLGDARRLDLSVFVNRNAQTYRGTYHVPYFFGLDLDTDIYVSREIETEETFTSRGWAVTFQQGRQIREPMRVQWSYTFRQADVEAVTAPGDPFGFDVVANRGILSASLIHDSRNSLTNPTRGWFWNGTTQFAATALGSDLRFVKFYGQLFYFRPVIGRGIVWASSYRAGVAQPLGDQVLLRQDRFQAGGPNSVRGFPNDELGPTDTLLGTKIGGEGVVVLNQELRIPVWKRFGAVVFYDAGNVYLDVKDFNPLDLRHTLGLGVRVQLPVGLARVDWARVLNPEPADAVSRFHFSFGHAF